MCTSAEASWRNGKAHGRNAKASSRTWEIRPSGIIGGLRKRSHGGNENPTRNRKSGLGNPSPTAGASELYPNRSAFRLRMPYALGAAVFWESCHWGVDDCSLAGLTARVALYIRQSCSRNCLKRVGRLGPCFDLRTILGDRHSTTHLRPWLQRRLLVS